ncbi:MAG: hypothetical protein HQ581_23760 [Planctomycetes bacterium]|nr:hypothetical protein [Planctomycetota bacterium]
METLQNEIAESKAETARINAEIEARELRHTELLEREVRNVTQQFPPFGLPTEYISDLPTEASDETPASHEFANFTPDQVARPAAQRDPGIPSAAKRATFAPF